MRQTMQIIRVPPGNASYSRLIGSRFHPATSATVDHTRLVGGGFAVKYQDHIVEFNDLLEVCPVA